MRRRWEIRSERGSQTGTSAHWKSGSLQASESQRKLCMGTQSLRVMGSGCQRLRSCCCLVRYHCLTETLRW